MPHLIPSLPVRSSSPTAQQASSFGSGQRLSRTTIRTNSSSKSSEKRASTAASGTSPMKKGAHSLRKFRLSRASPKKRPSRPPVAMSAVTRPAMIRDSWIDVAEDVQIDGRTALNGFSEQQQQRGRAGGDASGGLTGKRKRTWNLAPKSKPQQQQQQWQFQPKFNHSLRPLAAQPRPRKASMADDSPPRLPSLLLGRMTPIAGQSFDRLAANSDLEHEQENQAPLREEEEDHDDADTTVRPQSPPPSATLRSLRLARGVQPHSRAVPHGARQLPTVTGRDITRRSRLHTKPDRFDISFSTIPSVTASTTTRSAPAYPLPSLPPSKLQPAQPDTLPVPVPAFAPSRAASTESSTPGSASLSRRRSLEVPENDDRTQMTMTTIGTSILFTGVDTALHHFIGQMGRSGSATTREDGFSAARPSSPSPGAVPSDKEMQLAAALARYLCNRSDPHRADLLLSALRQESGGGNDGQCDVSHTSEATDLLSELVAHYKPTPQQTPRSARRGSTASVASSRLSVVDSLLRTPARQRGNQVGVRPRNASPLTTRRAFRYPLSPHGSPGGRSPIRSRRRPGVSSSREGSMRTARSRYSQSILSYCSTPMSSSADDLTSLLEGLMETSEGESGDEVNERGGRGTGVADPTASATVSAAVETPVARHAADTSAQTPAAYRRANSEAVAAVLDLYQPGNTPARLAKRKEPDVAPQGVRGAVGSPQRRKPAVTPTAVAAAAASPLRNTHQRRRSRRISIEGGPRPAPGRQQGPPMPNASAATTTAGVMGRSPHDVIVAHVRTPEMTLIDDDFFKGPRFAAAAATQHFPPTPPLSADRKRDKLNATKVGSGVRSSLGKSSILSQDFTPGPSTVIEPKRQLFSPVPALVITDADVEAKCKSLLPASASPPGDDPFSYGCSGSTQRIIPQQMRSQYAKERSVAPNSTTQHSSKTTRPSTPERLYWHDVIEQHHVPAASPLSDAMPRDISDINNLRSSITPLTSLRRPQEWSDTESEQG